MSTLSVVLLRPDYITGDCLPGQHIYVGFIDSGDVKEAIRLAREEVFNIDTEDELGPNDPLDYAVVLVAEGHINICMFGWQE